MVLRHHRRREDDQRSARNRARQTAYRGPLARRRCIIPASGYYEWQRRPDGGPQPFIHPPRGNLLIAGIFEWRRNLRSTPTTVAEAS
ncbi:SOS response-associated peptidase family protein [Jiangella asiatica]|uniref:SOS response-associated peptidase family protein n=1 Tax=Jiangella asiatica TaxID=2530372 RepID=UPI003B831E5E